VDERGALAIVDVVDRAGFRLPPCADPRFDHRSCDYWEDDVRGSKAARPGWWQGQTPRAEKVPPATGLADNPFAPKARDQADNPFAPTRSTPLFDPFADDTDEVMDNPFAPSRGAAPSADAAGAPRKLGLLTRGLEIFGSYAKVLEWEGDAAVYAQFGPLSAYPRAQRIRELYPRLPQVPLPAVITCIATAPAARGRGFAQRLVGAVCDDLAARGFSAIEAYPDLTLPADEASAASTRFWVTCGFEVVADDDRFPVMRRELA
jgi:ribosomal protein S18 acetylase RimI-like enzyme